MQAPAATVKGKIVAVDRNTMQRLHAALPQIRKWVDHLVADKIAESRKVSALRLARLAAYYPADILERARVVLVDKTPLPPLTEMGLPEFAEFERGHFDGITFEDMIFVVAGRQSESLLFHELVHVRQWSRLGFDRFLLAYAAGLTQFGYRDSPLERMAYSLQQDFERRVVPTDLLGQIDHESDAIWRQAQPILGPQ